MGTCFSSRTITNNTHSQSIPDAFIIQYVHSLKERERTNDIETTDLRRTVFVSAIGLYQTWKECPPATLYAALLVLPLKKIWVYDPTQFRQHISIYSDIDLDGEEPSEANSFLRMLKWKDEQGLVCWMLDTDESAISTSNIHPIWSHVNDVLQSLSDPVTVRKYEAIPLDSEWWKSTSYISKYNTECIDILKELEHASLSFKTLQEMLFQSNPTLLLPKIRYKKERESTWTQITDETEVSQTQDWFVSNDYDPDDIHTIN